jgi:hypothetical protein
VCILKNNEAFVIVAVSGVVKMTCDFFLLAVLLWTSFQPGLQVNLMSSTDIQALRVPVASRNFEARIHAFPSM